MEPEPTIEPPAATGDVQTNGEPPLDHGEPASQVNGSIVLRPVFLGNLSHTCTPLDLNLLFERPIVPVPFPDESGDPKDPFPVDRVDLKRGFCFIFLKDVKAQADKDRIERYISEVHGMHIEKVSKQLRAEFARGDGRIKRKEDARRQKITPSETLFVVNFHEDTTKREDLQMLFEPYGELIRIDMKRNYAFVQFSSVEESKRAKEATNGGKLDQSVITVEYVARKMGDRDHRDTGRRGDRDYDSGPRREPHGGPPRDSRGPRRDNDRDYYRGRDRYDDYPRGRDRYDDYPRARDRYDDYHPAARPPRGDDRDYDHPPPRDGFRGRGRSADRILREYEPSYRRSRSRSRSPPRRPRSRSPPRRGDYYDEYAGRGAGGRGRGAYDEERRRSRSYERPAGGGGDGGGAGAGNGASRERGERFRSDDRGYGGGARTETADA